MRVQRRCNGARETARHDADPPLPQPFGGAAGTRTGWGRVGGLSRLRDMTDLRCTIISLD
jgi:hypothetical protein